jgi:hypothetical protein
MRRADYLASIECLLSGKEYNVALWRDPWLVLSRSGTHAAAADEVRKKIQHLQEEWRVGPEDRTSAAACHSFHDGG